ncbi:thioredoxin family protein [Mesonia sp. K4-1]|uniref:thioredoxin family protein n=1 Tax=Mesonia sp. K4-1 TaxID=2602760 RepID=UPI0011C879CE|nr:thioredoxin family protein [Mesonia sp. K4-1]TXK76641.1 thioredoxin family protein [Mesonia sp. K4-1]
MKTLSLKKTIEEALDNAMSYTEYKTLMNDLLAENKSTAAIQEESLVEYSKLNQRRMKRWEKTLKITDEAEAFFKNYDQKMVWLVVSEGWCGDAAHGLPVLNALVELNPHIELKIVLRDSEDDLINQFLTNGAKSIPKLIMLKEENLEVIETWGPRPSTAAKLTADYKQEFGQLDASFKEDLQRWYNQDKGQTTIEDLQALLS